MLREEFGPRPAKKAGAAKKTAREEDAGAEEDDAQEAGAENRPLRLSSAAEAEKRTQPVEKRPRHRGAGRRAGG